MTKRAITQELALPVIKQFLKELAKENKMADNTRSYWRGENDKS